MQHKILLLSTIKLETSEEHYNWRCEDTEERA